MALGSGITANARRAGPRAPGRAGAVASAPRGREGAELPHLVGEDRALLELQEVAELARSASSLRTTLIPFAPACGSTFARDLAQLEGRVPAPDTVMASSRRRTLGTSQRSSSSTGRGMRQLGRSVVVPGTFGRSRASTASS